MADNTLLFKYRGARALIILHESHLRSFFVTWREAAKRNIKLPETDDPDYASLYLLLRHVLNSARGYMVWICKNLNLPDPEIDPVPKELGFIDNAENYLEHLILKWNAPLVNVPEVKFSDKVYKSNWGVAYCIDAMLEHAVMHPIRHEFQLKEILATLKN